MTVIPLLVDTGVVSEVLSDVPVEGVLAAVDVAAVSAVDVVPDVAVPSLVDSGVVKELAAVDVAVIPGVDVVPVVLVRVVPSLVDTGVVSVILPVRSAEKELAAVIPAVGEVPVV